MNRFSKELLSIDGISRIGKAARIIGYTNGLYTEWEASVGKFDLETYYDDKNTFVCLLAALSNEDLKECFGV